MAITAATLMVRVGADTSSAERNLSGFSARLRNIFSGVQGQASMAGSALSGIGATLGRIGLVGGALGAAGGLYLAARGVQAITSAVTSLGSEALAAYADYERLGMALQTLSARELVRTGQAESMSEAMGMATERAKELQEWIEKVAIESPFTSTDIANSLRLGLSFGFTTQQAQRLTQTMTDYAAGSGQTSEAISRATLALGQMSVRGKVTAQELNQLTEVGIDARNILASAFGVSTEQLEELISRGLVPAQAAIEAIAQSMEQDFGGAAAAQANTFSGLLSSLDELKTITLRDFFGPMFQEAQPYLAEFIATLQDPNVKTAIEEWGKAFGTFVGEHLRGASDWVRGFVTEINKGKSSAEQLGIALEQVFGKTWEFNFGPNFRQISSSPEHGLSWAEDPTSGASYWDFAMPMPGGEPIRIVRESDPARQMEALGLGDWTWTIQGEITTVTWGNQMVSGPDSPLMMTAKLVGDVSGSWLSETSKGMAKWLNESAVGVGQTIDGWIVKHKAALRGTEWAWPELPEWEWPSWEWPTLPEWEWPHLPEWTWPSIPVPDWLGSLLGLKSDEAPNPGTTHNFPRNPLPAQPELWTGPGYATGTDFHPGGLAVVGERGPELVNLPRGAQVFTNEETNRLLSDIPAYATGTGATPVTPPGAFFSGDLRNALAGVASDLGGASKEFKAAVTEFEGMLGRVPGLFGSSPVTGEQMELAEMGVPQNFADDYLRRLTDEVLHGVDWEGVDIQDAARRAGIDPSLPAEAILKLFGDAWRDSSLFANPENLDLINTGAVEEQMQRQLAAQAGRANIMQFLGLTEEDVQGQGMALTGDILAGLIQGISPEVTGPVGEKLFGSINDGLINAPTDASGQTFAAALQTSFGGESSTRTLEDAGARIADSIYRGYMDAVTGNYDWTPPIKPPTTTTPNTPTTPATKVNEVGRLAAGATWWRGGWSWVGERGPELVNLPRGAQVLNARQSAQAVQGGATINMQVVASANVDAEAIANRVMAILKRRMS